jgi:arylsulfatase A-like enzyme
VPLIFYGPGFRPGQYQRIVSAVDIAPTLCVWLGISSPTLATGEVLAEALLPRKRPEFIERKLVGPVPPSR